MKIEENSLPNSITDSAFDLLQVENGDRQNGLGDAQTELIRNFLCEQFEGKGLILPAGTGSGKTHDSIQAAVKVCLEDDSKLVQFVVPQKAMRSNLVSELRRQKDTDFYADRKHNDQMVFIVLKNGDKQLCALSLPPLADQKHLMKTIYTKFPKGKSSSKQENPSSEPLWNETLIEHDGITIADSLIALKKNLRKQAVQDNRQAKARLDRMALRENQNEEDWQLSQIRLNFRTLVHQSNNHFSPVSDDEIDPWSQARTVLFHSVVEYLNQDFRLPAAQSLLINELKEAFLQLTNPKKKPDGLALLLRVYPEWSLRFVHLCFATYDRMIFPFRDLLSTDSVLLTSKLYASRKACFVMDEIEQGAKAIRAQLRKNAKENPRLVLDGLHQVENRLACFHSRHTDSLQEAIFSQNVLFDHRQMPLIDCLRQIIDDYILSYGFPGEVTAEADVKKQLLRCPNFQAHELFAGPLKTPIYSFGFPNRTRLQYAARTEHARTVLEAVINGNRRSQTVETIPDSRDDSDGSSSFDSSFYYGSEICYHAGDSLRRILKVLVCCWLPAFYPDQLPERIRLSDQHVQQLKDIVNTSEVFPADSFEKIHNIEAFCLNEIGLLSLQRTNARSADSKSFWQGTHRNIILASFVRFFDLKSKNENEWDPVHQYLYELYSQLAARALNGNFRYWHSVISAKGFCPGLGGTAYVHHFSEDGLYAKRAAGSHSILHLNLNASAESLLCQLLEKGCRLLALSATGLLSHPDNLSWEAIKEELPGCLCNHLPDTKLSRLFPDSGLSLNEVISDIQRSRECYLNADHFKICHTIPCTESSSIPEQALLELMVQLADKPDWQCAMNMYSDFCKVASERDSGRYERDDGFDVIGWYRLSLFAFSYWDFLIHNQPGEDYISGTLLFTMKKPDSDTELNADRLYSMGNLQALANILIEKAQTEMHVPVSVPGRKPFVLLDHSRNSHSKTEIDRGLEQKLEKATEEYVHGKRTFFITSYQSFGAGYSLLFQARREDEPSLIKINEANFQLDSIGVNAIALDLPTHFLENEKHSLTNLMKACWLLDGGYISAEQAHQYITDPEHVHRASIPTYFSWMLSILIQAVGRAGRATLRFRHTWLYFSQRLVNQCSPYPSSIISKSSLTGSSKSAEVLLEALFSSADEEALLEPVSAQINIAFKQAAAAFKENFVPSNPDYPKLCEKLEQCTVLIQDESFFMQLPEAIKRCYIKIDGIRKGSSRKITPDQICQSMEDGSFRVFQMESKNMHHLTVRGGQYRLYNPFRHAGIEQLHSFSNAVPLENGSNLLTLCRDTLSSLPCLKQNRRLNRPGPVWIMGPDLAFKLRGTLAELCAPAVIDAIFRQADLPLKRHIPDTQDPLYEQFDFYWKEDTTGKILLGIDLKNFSKMPQGERADALKEKYEQRVKTLHLACGILLQLFCAERNLPSDDVNVWSRIVRLTENGKPAKLHAIGPLFNHGWQVQMDQVGMLQETAKRTLSPQKKESSKAVQSEKEEKPNA